MIDGEPNIPAALCFMLSVLFGFIWWRLKLEDLEDDSNDNDDYY